MPIGFTLRPQSSNIGLGLMAERHEPQRASSMHDRPFLLSGILGLGSIVMTVALSLVGARPTAPLPSGFITPILAFEFATTELEVQSLFAPVGQPAGDAVRAAMDRVNRLDFLYIALYGGCLLAFAMVCGRVTGERRYDAAAALAVGIMAADVLENMQLLTITRLLGVESIAANLAWLRLFTWLKWGGLALWFLLLWPYFRNRSGLARPIAVFAFAPALLAIVAFFRPGLASELFAVAIGLMFLLLTLYSWRYRRAAAVLTAVP